MRRVTEAAALAVVLLLVSGPVGASILQQQTTPVLNSSAASSLASNSFGSTPNAADVVLVFAFLYYGPSQPTVSSVTITGGSCSKANSYIGTANYQDFEQWYCTTAAASARSS